MFQSFSRFREQSRVSAVQGEQLEDGASGRIYPPANCRVTTHHASQRTTLKQTHFFSVAIHIRLSNIYTLSSLSITLSNHSVYRGLLTKYVSGNHYQVCIGNVMPQSWEPISIIKYKLSSKCILSHFRQCCLEVTWFVNSPQQRIQGTLAPGPPDV